MSIMRSVREPIIIDEFQRAPEILLAVKTLVDRRRAPGRFILTGSTRFMSLPKLSETLAGRAVILELWPFSVGEALRVHETFVDDLFSAGRFSLGTVHGEQTDYLSLACRGGFPVVLDRSPRSAARWLDSYVTTVTQRDVLELSRIQRSKDLLRTLKLAAARTATVLAADAGQMPVATVNDYLALLESVYLVRRVPAWSTNLTAKVAHHPKLHVTDTGLGAFLLGLDVAGAQARRAVAAGPLLETFVVNELEKQLGWSKANASLLPLPGPQRDRGRRDPRDVGTDAAPGGRPAASLADRAHGTCRSCPVPKPSRSSRSWFGRSSARSTTG
jgi:predicted AAA+ superfamily ATPase